MLNCLANGCGPHPKFFQVIFPLSLCIVKFKSSKIDCRRLGPIRSTCVSKIACDLLINPLYVSEPLLGWGWEGATLFFIAVDLAFSSGLYEEIKNKLVKQQQQQIDCRKKWRKRRRQVFQMLVFLLTQV